MSSFYFCVYVNTLLDLYLSLIFSTISLIIYDILTCDEYWGRIDPLTYVPGQADLVGGFRRLTLHPAPLHWSLIL